MCQMYYFLWNDKVVLCLPYGKENISFKSVQRYLNSYILSDYYKNFGFFNWNMIWYIDTNVKKKYCVVTKLWGKQGEKVK